MRYILDTHAFLWYAEGDSKLSLEAKELIDNVTNEHELYLSVASVWEMAIKTSLNKLTFNIPFNEQIEQQLSLNNIQLLGIDLEHLYKVLELPFYHRDPFDRLLISQSLIEKMPIISVDESFFKYENVVIIW